MPRFDAERAAEGWRRLRVVRFENVGMRYGLGSEVLHDVSFHLAPGSFHFLVGNSGAGKSSLLRLMYLGHRPSRGLISILGQDVTALPRSKLPPLRRRIGVVFQDFRLLDHLSVLDNVGLPLRVMGYPRDKIRTHAGELLKWVGLGERMHAPPSTLSGGEKQRVAIARAVITKPSLLLADEPTGNIDDRMGMRLMRLLQELNKMAVTVVVATHNEGLVARFEYPRLRVADGRLGPDPG
ncbi:MAG: cell division ATP-binding protein FtsE [Proteobacteria bacterium]|nr:cell division ATP-binding protein FtsE [Pseudomonadota bacterium]